MKTRGVLFIFFQHFTLRNNADAPHIVFCAAVLREPFHFFGAYAYVPVFEKLGQIADFAFYDEGFFRIRIANDACFLIFSYWNWNVFSFM